MTYANLVLAPGADAFARSAAAAGASGLIVPDLPLEEAPAVLEACDAAGVALVPLVAPTTPDERLARIGARARGFLYTVSVTGTTGERAALADAFAEVVARAAVAHRRARRPGVRDLDPRAGGRGRGRGRRRHHRRQPPRARRRRGPRRAGRGRRRARPRRRASRRPSARVRGAMGFVLATTAGLVVWIVLWAIGAKAIDAFLVTVVIVAGGPGRPHHAAVPAGPRVLVAAPGYHLDGARGRGALRRPRSLCCPVLRTRP